MDLRQFFSILLVFALLGGALWIMRRVASGRLSLSPRALNISLNKSGHSKLLVSVERLALTPNHSLHLIRIHGRDVVVSTHPQGCAILIDGPAGTGL
jgi:hypothetical protein